MQQAATWTESLGEDIDGEGVAEESIQSIEQNKNFVQLGGEQNGNTGAQDRF